MAPRGHGDAGFSLIELLVAISILGVVMTGLAAGLITALDVTADSRDRTIAANLASQEIDLAGAVPADRLTDGTVFHTEDVQGTRFDVTRVATWEQGVTEARACTALANSATGRGRRFLQVNVTVRWEGQGLRGPVRASTAMTPAVASYRNGFGHVAVTVVDRDAAPVAGVTVTLTGPGVSRVVPTTSIGCAFFSDVPPGTSYRVTVDKPGHVDQDAATPGYEEPLVVEDRTTTKRQFTYDRGVGLDLTVAGRFGGVIPNGIVVTARSNAATSTDRLSEVGAGTAQRTIGATQADGTPTRTLFPHTGGWTTWAGCAANQPEAATWVEAGGTRVVNSTALAPAPGLVGSGTVNAGTLQIRAREAQSARAGQPLYAVDTGAVAGSPCAAPLLVGTFGALGSFSGDVALPIGDWQLVYGTASTPIGGVVRVGPYAAALYAETAFLPYFDEVRASGPFLYYRLGEAANRTALDSSINARNGTYQSGVTFPVTPGAITGEDDGAARFDGTANAYVSSSPTTLSNPSPFSLEVWFRVANGYASGGRLIGFSNARTGTSTRYDRHVYLRNDGQLVWGTYTRTTASSTVATQTVATNRQQNGVSVGYNDGLWHHVVATVGPAGMALYVDGALAASRADVVGGEAFVGYVRVGHDNLATWPAAPSSSGIVGDLDEAAAYTSALPATRVTAHHAARTSTGYAGAVRADSPFLHYRFDDPGAADSSGNARHGSYRGAVTLGRTGALTGDTDTAVGVSGLPSRVDAGDVFDRTGRSPFTLELWVRPTLVDGDYRPLVDKEPRFGTRNGVSFWHQGQYGVGLERRGGGARDAAVSNTPLAVNVWQHVAGTYDGTTLRVYVNGVERGSAVSTLSVPDIPDPLLVGGWGFDYIDYRGDLDEVALYETALPAAEIARHYRSGRP